MSLVKARQLLTATGDLVSSTNPLPVSTTASAAASTAFGEQQTASPTPVWAVKGTNGIPNTVFEQFSATGGSIDTNSGQFRAQSGTSLGGYGVLRTLRSLAYHPGQGSLLRFTGKFTTGVANSIQIVGAGSAGAGYFFGYDGTSFGVAKRTGGLLELQRLTVNDPATGAETVTLTLDGTNGGSPYSVPVTSGTVQQNAHEIATWMNANQTAWQAFATDDTVLFIAQSLGDKTGTMSVSSSGTLTGSLAEVQAGADSTYTWIPQESWNGTALQATLDPTKGNVFQIQFQYLGYGIVTFSVEEPSTGEFVPVHRIAYANANTEPNISEPTMFFEMSAASLGSSGTNLTVECSSAAAFVQGMDSPTGPTPGTGFVQTGVDESSIQNIVAIRNRRDFDSRVNVDEITPLVMTISSESSSKSGTAYLMIDPVLASGTPDWQYLDEANSRVEVLTTKVSWTPGLGTLWVPLGPNGNEIIDLTPWRPYLRAGGVLAIGFQYSSTATATVIGGLGFRE